MHGHYDEGEKRGSCNFYLSLVYLIGHSGVIHLSIGVHALAVTLRGNEQKHLSLSCIVHCLSTTLSLLFSSLATNNIKVEC